MEKNNLEKRIALVGNPDSYGYKVISLFDGFESITLDIYSPQNVSELNTIKKELFKIKYGCLFICTHLLPKNRFSWNKKGGIDLPLGLRLLKDIKSKGSTNKDSFIYVIGERGDYTYKEKAKKIGADRYIC